jgi:hypothetical protein
LSVIFAENLFPRLGGLAATQSRYAEPRTRYKFLWDIEKIIVPLRRTHVAFGAECRGYIGRLQRGGFVDSMDVQPSHSDEAGPGEQTLAAYIGDLTKELSKMARSAHYEALARLLDHASREAQEIDASSERRLPS